MLATGYFFLIHHSDLSPGFHPGYNSPVSLLPVYPLQRYLYIYSDGLLAPRASAFRPIGRVDEMAGKMRRRKMLLNDVQNEQRRLAYLLGASVERHVGGRYRAAMILAGLGICALLSIILWFVFSAR
jgi:hypothetical protein